MRGKNTNELTHKEFLDSMKKNSRVVQRMPGWMKGSPVNKRMYEVTSETTSKNKSAKASAHPSR